MIKVGNTTKNNIKVGSRTPSTIKVGSRQVWPTGYYYVLTYKRTNYSSGTKLLPNASNYATFTCDYKKYSVGGTLVSTEEVLAVPSAAYCVNSVEELRFDKDNYGTTQVAADTAATVNLSYRGASTTATVSVGSNTSTLYSTITPIVLSDSEVGASGGTLTYTGGDYTTVRRWTSGIDEPYATGAAGFSLPAQNSSVSTVYAYAISATKTITINSLDNNQTGAQTYYDLVSDNYGNNSANVTVRVYQAKNSYHQTSNYYIWNPDTNEAYPQSGILVPTSPAGYIKFQVRQATTTTWDSGYQSSSSTNTLNHSSYSYSYQSFMGGGCITGIGYYDSNYTLQANYSANQGSQQRISGIFCTSQSPSFNLVLQVTQPY